MTSLKPGDQLHGFTVTSIIPLEEYRGTGIRLKHDVTGLDLFHLLNDDPENVFSFIFKTPPGDDTGAAHIVEHSVLSGSANYPVKDPFVSLMKGSMNTFLNALTYPDKTVYPAASPVEKDFYNLMAVYGDAVFFPLLRREIFLQEGHRIERNEYGNGENPGAGKSGADIPGNAAGLVYSGVVFNEMKGAYSTHDSIVGEWAYRTLFPDSPYRFDSGGDPKAILDLTYEEFVAFHRVHYHPSNCRIFLYGDIPTGKHLQFLQERFLGSFSAEPENGAGGKIPLAVEDIPFQTRWTRPRDFVFTSPLGEDEDPHRKSTIVVSYLLDPVIDPLTLLSFEVLIEILLGNAGAPLYKAIIDSGLGEDISPVSGLETELKEMVFTLGIRGTDPENAEDFERLLEQEFAKLVEEGIPSDVLEGTIKRVEFRNREIKGGSPFGLRLMGKTLRGWLNGMMPETTLTFSRWMEMLKKKVHEDPGYFEHLIRTRLIENPHRATVTVKPDTKQMEKDRMMYDERLDRIKNTLDEAALSVIDDDNAALKLFQETPDSPSALASIPSLSMEDLPEDISTIDTCFSTLGEVPCYSHDLFTNGILYFDFAFDIRGLSGDELVRIPLFLKMLTSTGFPDLPYDQVSRLMSLKTGGLYGFVESGKPVGKHEEIKDFLFFRLKCLEGDLQEALDLVIRIFSEAVMDDAKRLKDIAAEHRNDFLSAVIPAGHSFALLRAASRLNASAFRDELWRGIEQLQFSVNLFGKEGEKEGGRGDFKFLGTELSGLKNKLITPERLTVNVTGEGNSLKRALSVLDRTLDTWGSSRRGAGKAGSLSARVLSAGVTEASVPKAGTPGAGAGITGTVPVGNTGRWESFIIPAPVNYTGAAFNASSFEDERHAAETLAAYLLKTEFLWEQVRMKGGAYGVSASANGMEGVFSFSSYRDPNIGSTFQAFKKGLENIAGGEIPRSSIEKGIITLVGKDVKPLSPGEKSIIGFRRKLYGITDELRRKKRGKLINIDRKDIAEASGALLDGYDAAARVVIGGKERIEEEGVKFPGLVESVQVLPL